MEPKHLAEEVIIHPNRHLTFGDFGSLSGVFLRFLFGFGSPCSISPLGVLSFICFLDCRRHPASFLVGWVYGKSPTILRYRNGKIDILEMQISFGKNPPPDLCFIRLL